MLIILEIVVLKSFIGVVLKKCRTMLSWRLEPKVWNESENQDLKTRNLQPPELRLVLVLPNASQSCLALQWIQPLLKIAPSLVQPCSAPPVVLDGLPIILQRAALTKAAVLNSLLLHFTMLNSLSPVSHIPSLPSNF